MDSPFEDVLHHDRTPPVYACGRILFCLITTPSLFAQSFFLKKGDIVVVMGDSITEQRLYSNYLEIWAQTRFPSYQLVFRNVGIGGDRSVGGNARFKRDVLPLQSDGAFTCRFRHSE